MAVCEKCWSDAYFRSLSNGKSQSENYHELLEERKDNPCVTESTTKQEDNFYCADWNRCGSTCEEQCPACKKTNLLEDQKQEGKWISVKDRPLFIKSPSGWVATEDGEQEFLAAIEEEDGWWIKHCIIEDYTGLAIVGDTDNEPAPYELQDVEFWMPLPEPPTK